MITYTNHTRDKEIGLSLRGRPIFYHSYEYRASWTPQSYYDYFYQIVASARDSCRQVAVAASTSLNLLGFEWLF